MNKHSKILYIFFNESIDSNDSGVDKKVLSKIEALNKFAHCDCIMFSHTIENTKIINDFVKIIPYKNNIKGAHFQHFQRLKNKYDAIDKWLEDNISNYDSILFRYPMASWGLYKLVKKYSHKISFEHNTKEIEELQLTINTLKKRIPFTLRPSGFKYYFEFIILPLWYEKYLAPFIFKNSKSGISVTNEIARYEENRCKTYKNFTVSNGINVEDCSLRTLPHFNGIDLKLFMLIGCTANWHGVDRLIKGLEAYKGKLRITIDIIGGLTRDDLMLLETSIAKDRINNIPALPFKDLNSFLNDYHIGIGTLAAFRKGLHEASPLKVREYFARGFSCVLAYKDTDLINNKEFSPYYLSLPEDFSPIDFSDVETFASTIFKNNHHHEQIRSLAKKTFDMDVKAKAMLAYLVDNI